MENRRTIAVLGATGSVGVQALDVAAKQNMNVDAMAIGSNVLLAEEQIRRFLPRFVGVKEEKAAADLRVRIADLPTKLFVGPDSAAEVVSLSSADTAVNAVTGIAGLNPTIAAIKSGKHVALANKETMVAWGEHVMAMAKQKGVQILPVDSEHCAIFQCLRGNRAQDVARLWLTASGGPFYRRSREEIANMTAEQALAHPTWRMGPRITIDSASMMNKGFEVIEAVRLFGVPADAVSVLIHPESIIHSMVEYIDRAVMAQLSVPDMRLCVQYALSCPSRTEGILEHLDLAKIGALHFEAPDLEKFPLLALAFEAVKRGGVVPAAMNAADEEAVSLFLAGKIRFEAMVQTVLTVTRQTKNGACETLEQVLTADAEARAAVHELVGAFC